MTETLGNHFFASSGAIASFAAIQANPFEVIHDPHWLEQQGLQRDGEDRFITALIDRLNSPAAPLGSSNHGPLSWGSMDWQQAALNNGGRRMLSTGGARSSQRASPHPAWRPARQRGGIRLALQAAAGTMTLLLVSDEPWNVPPAGSWRKP